MLHLVEARTEAMTSLLKRRSTARQELDAFEHSLTLRVGEAPQTKAEVRVPTSRMNIILKLDASLIRDVLQERLDALDAQIERAAWVPPAAPQGAAS